MLILSSLSVSIIVVNVSSSYCQYLIANSLSIIIVDVSISSIVIVIIVYDALVLSQLRLRSGSKWELESACESEVA